MATIKSTAETKIYTIGKWLGVNENPDGDTKLKIGEASEMRNWRVTKDGHLQIRPGYGVFSELGTEPVVGMWSGYISGEKAFIAACGGKLYSIAPDGEKTEIGEIEGEHAHFFGFSEKLYLLTGSKYYVYDGETLSEVEGYVPLISVSNPPAGGGTLLQQINKLTASRRAWYSPDGTATAFQLPEKDLASVDYVKKTADGVAVTFTGDVANGTVTISPAPANGTNSIEIGWTVKADYREQVEAMRFSEVYNGEADTRIFLYGDGSNKALYSGLDYNGLPCADYFPDLNEVAADSANTPITAMIRHYDRLLTFKPDGAFMTTYGMMTLADNTTTAAFYTSAINREIGNIAPGQAVLVKNNPITLFGRSAYEWLLGSFSARDERNAKRKSDRVTRTLGELDLKSAVCYDDEYNSEYYICCEGKCVIYNYTADAWYIYDNIPAASILSVDGKLYFGTPDGRIMLLSREYRNDGGAEINAFWASGAMDFARDYKLKYSTDIWIAMKPESQARLTVTAQSNRNSDYEGKVIASSLSTFTHANFRHWSFATNRQPQVERIKLKVKKYVFYRLILESLSASATATVLGTDIKVRFAGNVK